MNAYWTAHLSTILSGDAPIWEARLLDDASAGSVLISNDDGDTWRRARASGDDFGCAALALQAGRSGQNIKMMSRGNAIIHVLAPDYTPLRIGQVGEDGTVALDLREEGV